MIAFRFNPLCVRLFLYYVSDTDPLPLFRAIVSLSIVSLFDSIGAILFDFSVSINRFVSIHFAYDCFSITLAIPDLFYTLEWL